MNPLYAMIEDFAEHEDYQEHTGYYFEHFLNNTLGYQDKNITKMGSLVINDMRVDVHTEYKTNNFGFRCEEWISPAEILGVGCSNTYGLGIPSDASWPKILGKIAKKDVHNLSKPGVSIQELVFQIFAYFKKIGHPQTVVCLFPDPFRMIVPVKTGLIGAREDIEGKALDTIYLDKYTNTKISDRKKYLKIPYSYEDILPMEFSLFYSMKAIHMLEQYCITNNINLVWSSWNDHILQVFDKLDNIPFRKFLYSQEFVIDTGISSECHKEYENEYNKYFSSGQDIENGTEYAHSGVHKHVHIAETFYKEITK